MNPTTKAARLGLIRGWIEFKQFIKNGQEIGYALFINGIFIAVLFFQRNSTIDGVQLAMLTLPGLLGMTIALGGLMNTSGSLSYDREDGTLLRAKATPQGMVGYMTSRLVLLLLTTIFSLVLLAIPGVLLVDGLTGIGLAGVATLSWLFVLGLLATSPWGAIIGSMVKSSSSGFGITMLFAMGIIAISGIFYPLEALPGWLQTLGQVFPVYWLGEGIRSIFIPGLSGWNPGTTVAILGAWSIAGLLFAPRVLRRMAQKESGSDVEARRQRVIQRGY